MKVSNPQEYVGKEVVDCSGKAVGIIDKFWNSWNNEYPGPFFGIRPKDTMSTTWFRGTSKLIPISSNYIKEAGSRITLHVTTEQLEQFWNKTVPCGSNVCPMDKLVEMPVYDRDNRKVGTFFGWVEDFGTYKNYSVFADPYLYEYWHLPVNTLMPIPTDCIMKINDTISLDKTLDELRQYWQQYQKC